MNNVLYHFNFLNTKYWIAFQQGLNRIIGHRVINQKLIGQIWHDSIATDNDNTTLFITDAK